MSHTTVHVIQHLIPGGIECLVLQMAKQAQGNENVHIVALEGDPAQLDQHWSQQALAGVNIHSLEKPKGVSISAIKALSALFKNLNADVVHTHHLGPLLYGGLAAKIAGIRRVIHTEHDAWHLNNSKHRFIENILIRITKPLLVADANHVADSLKTHLNGQTSTVIHNGVNTNMFTPGDKIIARQNLNLPLSKKIVGSAGRLEWVKGHDVLIRSLVHLAENIHVAIAGKGSERNKLESLAKDLGVTHRCHFIGHCENINEFYQCIDVFCLPSRNEGFPLAPLEAQSCNCPVVATDVGGCKEAICENTGLVVAPEDPIAMAKALSKQLACFQSKYTPRQFVVSQMSFDKMAQKYRQLAAQ